MYIRFKHVFKIESQYWCGYKTLHVCFGRLAIHYKFLGWRSKSWKRNDIQGNKLWNMWYKNPFIGFKKLDNNRFSIYFLLNDFTFTKIRKKSLDIYYSKVSR